MEEELRAQGDPGNYTMQDTDKSLKTWRGSLLSIEQSTHHFLFKEALWVQERTTRKEERCTEFIRNTGHAEGPWR